MSKEMYREFWIDKFNGCNSPIYLVRLDEVKPLDLKVLLDGKEIPANEIIHVIEKTAYYKAVAERDVALRALAIESNNPEERTQEAAHYNWLDDQNEKLTLEINELKAEHLHACKHCGKTELYRIKVLSE